LHIQLLVWEDTVPRLGRPQELINEDVDKADLFIGCLWQRWGSPPKHQEYSSGFEEEFYRAIERNKKTGSPQMSLFFKKVDASALGDPGEHLKMILKFKSGLIESKELLFREFKDPQDWTNQTRDLLLTHLLRIQKEAGVQAMQTQPQQPVEQKATDAARIPEIQEKIADAARHEVALLWNEAGDAIQKGELSAYGNSTILDRLKVARLGLAASSKVARS
jgi:hypothetical protein